MKDKNFFVIAALLVVIVLIGGAVYFYKTKPAEESAFQETPQGNAETEKSSEETVLAKDGFALTLPVGWTEITPPQENILAMGVDSREEINDEKVKETGFRTNLSIQQDDLSKYEQPYSLSDYVDSVKTSLMQAIPGIEFAKEEQGEINGFDAVFVECWSTQEEIDFATLLVFFKDANNFIWAISFNTLHDSWLTYQDVFYQIAESFKLE